MLVIDVDLDVLKSLNKNPTAFFYKETPNIKTEIYTEMNGMLFRYTYQWKNDENDVLFYERYLSNALRIYDINIINGDKWQEVIIEIYKKLDEIKDSISGLNGNE